MVSPDSSGGDLHLVPAPASSVPAMPRVGSQEIWHDSPFLLLNGVRGYSLGSQRWPDKKGGPGFVVARVGRAGSAKLVERFPFTEEGWRRAWLQLVALDLWGSITGHRWLTCGFACGNDSAAGSVAGL